jgi:very-short-patch-repair endonuclease
LEGLKFRRQQPLGSCIADFVCFEKSLVIEIDGGQHANNKKDEARDRWLSAEGYKVLRFWNNEVLTNMEGVLDVIRQNCSNHPPPTPPLKGGEV